MEQHALPVVALPSLATLVVRGPDRVAWLDRMASNSVKLPPGRGCYCTFLDPRGRIVTDADVRVYDDRIEIDTDVSRREALADYLDKYIIMEDVQLERVDRVHVGLLGPAPRADEKEGVFDVESPVTTVRTWFGYELILAPELRGELEPTADYAEFEKLRVERGVPRFGVDFVEDTNPLEVGLYRALDFKKGCYTGQEVIAKTTFRGHVKRRLVRLGVEGAPPAPGTEVVSHDTFKGAITSSAQGNGEAIALGWVHWLSCPAGTKVKLADGREATVLGWPYESSANPVNC